MKKKQAYLEKHCKAIFQDSKTVTPNADGSFKINNFLTYMNTNGLQD